MGDSFRGFGGVSTDCALADRDALGLVDRAGLVRADARSGFRYC